ncbi:MAG: winged helix-turn-helix domain-containing protein [Polyangiaceae bacterium]
MSHNLDIHPLNGNAPLLRVDKNAHEVSVSERAVGLTAKEFALLAYFVDHRGQAVSRSQLLEAVWGRSYSGSQRTVDIHVRRLRTKLGAAFDLVTLRGVGYRLGSAVAA